MSKSKSMSRPGVFSFTHFQVRRVSLKVSRLLRFWERLSGRRAFLRGLGGGKECRAPRRPAASPSRHRLFFGRARTVHGLALVLPRYRRRPALCVSQSDSFALVALDHLFCMLVSNHRPLSEFAFSQSSPSLRVRDLSEFALSQSSPSLRVRPLSKFRELWCQCNWPRGHVVRFGRLQFSPTSREWSLNE